MQLHNVFDKYHRKLELIADIKHKLQTNNISSQMDSC